MLLHLGHDVAVELGALAKQNDVGVGGELRRQLDGNADVAQVIVNVVLPPSG